MRKSWMYVIGFLLFGMGILSVLLNLLGLQFSFLSWINALSPLGSLIVRIFMIFGGMVIIVLGRLDLKEF